ncbi:sensor histidine kinase [Jiangella anatolica]|uniref:Oxygen sensor histidine kinase NreB n=1 Tax=Jiangella anatolica TaxID=2670374 RepID=A0A2W2B906_9ACTN|nr:sensor histidine kinase [Jiangella anatolica]PZF81660.1 two-component sensor histidine kinase [Jiangella anatolica]
MHGPRHEESLSGQRRSWRHGARADVLLAAAVGVFVVLTTVVGDGDPVGLRAVPALGWLLIVAGSAALAVRRRFPVATAVVTLVATSVYYPVVNPDGAILLTLIIALYTLAATGRTVAAAVIGGLAIVGSAFGEYGTDASPLGDAGMFLLVGWLVAAVAIGGFVHSSRREREEALRRRATEERLRIARELHDVLGHNISLINVQAGAALHALERDGRGGPAADALAAIKETSREALRELRGTLGVLRQVDEAAPTGPAPGLRRLAELAERSRAAGLAVDVETDGEPAELTPAVDLAAYRIVQEALTNVTRHAGAGRVAVRIGYGRDDVTVDVSDDGRGAGSRAGTGSGIDGMRSRAEALGGTLEAADRPGGGFRVRARLPYGGRP